MSNVAVEVIALVVALVWVLTVRYMTQLHLKKLEWKRKVDEHDNGPTHGD
jgi:hypothetical protein